MNIISNNDKLLINAMGKDIAFPSINLVWKSIYRQKRHNGLLSHRVPGLGRTDKLSTTD